MQCIFEKNYIMDENDSYPNTLRSHFVTIVPMAPFTPRSTSVIKCYTHGLNSLLFTSTYTHTYVCVRRII